MIGEEEDGLYTMNSQSSDEEVTRQRCSIATQDVDANVSHQRFCHVPMALIRKIPSFQRFDRTFALHNCEICPLAKQTRVSFPHSISGSTCNFQLIHMDIWDPFRVETFDGMRYFLTIFDDFSRWT